MVQKKRTIADMVLGEAGFSLPWAVGEWNWLPYPEHLDGLNLSYPVYPSTGGTITMPISRTEDGWVIDKKLFKEPSSRKKKVSVYLPGKEEISA